MEISYPGLFTGRGCCKCEALAHEAVVIHCEPSQPNPGHGEADVVRSVRPLGVKNADI